MAKDYLTRLYEFEHARAKLKPWMRQNINYYTYNVVPFRFQSWARNGLVITLEIRQGFENPNHKNGNKNILTFTKLHGTVQHAGDTRQLPVQKLNPVFE